MQKIYRLRANASFNYLYRNGTVVSAPLLRVHYIKASSVKVGVSVGKKVGNSVVRHRAIRLMREAVKPYLPRMAPNNSYIFIAKEGITAKHLDEIKLQTEKVLKKAGLIY